MGLLYKFIELSIVTDQTIEDCVNAGVADGWRWDGIRFVVTEHSRRPAMAFVSFVRDSDDAAPAVRPSPVRPAAHLPITTEADVRGRRKAPPPIELGELDLGDLDPRDFDLGESSSATLSEPAPVTSPASRSRSTPAPRRAAADRAGDRDRSAPARSGRRRPARR